MSNTVKIDIPESKMEYIKEYEIDVENLCNNALDNKISWIKRNNPEPDLSEDILQRIQNFHQHVKHNDNLAAFHEGLPYNGISIGANSKGKYYNLEIKISDIQIIPDLNISDTIEDSSLFLNQIKNQIVNSISEIDNNIIDITFNLTQNELSDNKFESDNIVYQAKIKT